LKELKPLWLAWLGEEMPQVWRLDLRRFTIDHWYRFLKQRLHWTLPKLSTPKQCERWSDLMLLMTWELWLARDIVTDNPIPRAEVSRKINPWKSCSSYGWSFCGDWYSNKSTQTSWKVPWLGTRKKASP